MADNLSSRPWDGSASRWPDTASYAASCLINDNTGPRASWTKDKCHLPVKEPGSGDYNRAALGAAAAALAGARGNGMSIPPAAKKAAARKLVSIYRRFKLPIPDSLQKMAL